MGDRDHNRHGPKNWVGWVCVLRYFKGVYSTTRSNVRRYSEFQVCGAATENARRANSVRVLAADSSRASEDRRDIAPLDAFKQFIM